MTKRIAYLLPAGDPASRVPDDVLSDEVTVDVLEYEGFLLPISPVEAMVTEVAVTAAAMRAEKLGYDGVLLSSPDYGFAAVRAALRIPVAACSQAAVLTAVSIAERFSIVTIWPASSQFLTRAVVDRASLTDRCASTRHVTQQEEMVTLGDEDNFYTRMLARRQDMIERIGDEINAAVEEDGAQAIVFGCNCMNGVAPILAERTGIPVIDPTRAGYAFMSLLLRLGLTHSETAHGTAGSDRSAIFASMVNAAAETMRLRGDEEECEVCVLGDSASCEPATVEPVATTP
jgi:allantoin racemase